MSSVPCQRESVVVVGVGAGLVVIVIAIAGMETRKQTKGAWGCWGLQKVCYRKHTPPRWSSRMARIVQDVEPDRSQRRQGQEQEQCQELGQAHLQAR